jgi:hypothetical protein
MSDDIYTPSKDDIFVPSRDTEGGSAWTRQTFNRIRSIEARAGMVLVNIKEDNDPNYIGRSLESQVWTIKQAAHRAKELNSIAHQLPEKDRKVAFDIVKDVIAACLEAKKQSQNPDTRRHFKLDQPDGYAKAVPPENIEVNPVDYDCSGTVVADADVNLNDKTEDQARPSERGDAGETVPPA